MRDSIIRCEQIAPALTAGVCAAMLLSGCIPIVQSIYAPESPDGVDKSRGNCGMESIYKKIVIADGVSVRLQTEGGDYVGLSRVYIDIQNESSVRFASTEIRVTSADGSPAVSLVITSVRGSPPGSGVTNMLKGPRMYIADVSARGMTLKADHITIQLPSIEVNGLVVNVPPVAYRRLHTGELAAFCF